MPTINTPVRVTFESFYKDRILVVETHADKLIELFDRFEILEVFDLETGEIYYYNDPNSDPAEYMAESLKTFLGTL